MPRPSDGSAAAVTSDAASSQQLLARLERVVAHDMTALGELFAEYGDLVYRTALRLTRHRADAEDATQDVFLRLPAAASGFTGTAANFPGWIRRVACRQALMTLRTGRRRREVNAEGVAALVSTPETGIDRLTIDAALARISEDHRMVFLLKEVEGYGHAEIAELLGISTANSEVRLHRARRELRGLLGGPR